MIRKYLIAIILSLTASAASAQVFPRGGAGQEAEKELVKFQQFYEFLNHYYVDTLDNHKLIEDAIVKVLSELDPHSSYSSAEEMKAISESFEGSFSGIGVEFDVLLDTLVVVNTIPGGPAEKVGVQSNDRIVKIDNRDAVGISRVRVPKLLRGPKGTPVTIDVLRRGMSDTLHFHITRDNIPIHTIDAAYKVTDDVGYIKVNRFAETTMNEFKENFAKLGKLDGLILDLRGNGGGLLWQAIELSEFFLPAGSVIVSTEGRNIAKDSFVSRRNGRFTKGKLVVLLDAGSASGSEIVAGAIQDWDRGILIGQPTFGKGLVQRQVPLVDSSAVRITIARYHTPTGRVIQRPYEQGNSAGYYIDHLMRSVDQTYADSLNADAPVYKTLRKGRTVIGGGGIHPDIFIPLDTTRNYSFWNQLTRAGLINQWVNTYLDTNREKLAAEYADFESFRDNFTVTGEMIGEIVEAGKKQNIGYTTESAEESLPGIRLHIKAMLAQKLWTTTEYYRIINAGEDESFARAMEVLDNWTESSKILSPPAD